MDAKEKEELKKQLKDQVNEDVENLKAAKKRAEVKVSQLRSIRTQILLMVALGVIATGILAYMSVEDVAGPQFSSTMDNYLMDSVTCNGQLLTEMMEFHGEEVLEEEDHLDLFRNVRVDGQESSYLYLVGLDGTMLLHPDQSKIGQPVENAVVNQILKDIAGGARPETDVYEYEYRGGTKYAAVYTDVDNGFVMVISADKGEVTAKVDAILLRTFLGCIFAFVVCMIIAVVLATIITTPIKQMAKITGVYADLDLRKNEKEDKILARKDEIGMMGNAMGYLREKLNEVIKDIQLQSKHLFTASNELHQNAEQTAGTIEQVEKAVLEIADGATSQASETQKATENVIRMGNMIEETDEQVQNLYDNANLMKQAGDAALQILSDLNRINQRAKESIDVIYEQTNTTNTSAMKIREATNLITSIAEETNLLSLNASIEAARAGEQGRGFAVVASQIQKLAEQSDDSAKQIETIINELITDSTKAVETMDEVKNIMAEQSANVTKTEEKFAEVKGGIDTSIDGVNKIANSTKLLDEARVVVVDVVQNLTAIAQENAASTEETSASVTEVSGIILQISQSVGELQQIASRLDEQMREFIV